MDIPLVSPSAGSEGDLAQYRTVRTSDWIASPFQRQRRAENAGSADLPRNAVSLQCDLFASRGQLKRVTYCCAKEVAAGALSARMRQEPACRNPQRLIGC